MDVALEIGLVLLFVLIGGFFAAAEIALVSLRSGQVSALAESGARGRAVARLRGDSNRFLSAVQIGVTFTGFFASSYGGATLAGRLEPGLEGIGLPVALAATVALVIVTAFVSYLSLVAGELVPKRLALQKPEAVSLTTAPVLDRLASLTRPLIWLLSVSTNAVVRVLGVDPKQTEDEVSEDELRDMVRTTSTLTDDERRLLTDAFEATDRVISEVMVPRTEVDFLDAELTAAEAVVQVSDRPHSRYPVTGESVDDVLGFVHVRDLLTAHVTAGGTSPQLRDIVRTVTVLPGSKPVLDTLSLMRRGGGHLAVVIDEYGGTDGIVTVEDLVEEIVGEIRDEYDPKAVPARPLDDGTYEADGLLHRTDVADQTGIELPDGSFDTLGGFVLQELGRTPAVGDVVEALDHRFAVTAVDGLRVARVRITPLVRDDPAEASPES
ncbi:hemolysin family protein [Actinomycetospora straminea]|uniref:Hemolysin family protein n=1 Tax=Actinomycetospora straminea TaxID=663607 RepID=A0ABP9ED95_9PSEU|nr:hemolysin family protein [Actinomycetospora straminea]MDD7932250.1 hemolysin family protein [Actinomycetospora straminea]